VRVVLALMVLAVCASPAQAVTDKPDLVIRLPGEPKPGEAAPVFVDAYEEPGKLLYRFNTVIANVGGTLDLFRGPDGGVEQAVWPGGVPPQDQKPRPDVTPSDPAVVNDRSNFGSTFSYAVEKTHQHFHFSSAARYSLLPANAPERVSDKIGFCLLDSLYPDPDNLFDYNVKGAAGETWCGFNRPTQATVRMGLSPGGADIYYAQQERQWVDITGLAPGPVTVKAQANPLHCILESDETNNQTTASRQIPGVRVADVSGGSSLVLAGTVVAPEVPARRSGGCDPGSSKACYVWGSATGPLTFRVVGEPAHGTVALAPGADGLHAAATYTPEPGFTGEDSFRYVATDARGLTSAPATARVRIDAPPVGSAPGPSPATTDPVAARLSDVRVVRRHGRWRVQLRASAPARLSGRLERQRGRWRVVKRLRTRSVGAGSAKLAIGRLQRGRYRLKLLVNGRVAARARFRERF
jgi:hypothetical protein